MANFSKTDRAIQRQEAYALLSLIFAQGLTPAVLSRIQEIPVLAGTVPPGQDPDQAAAVHQDVFGFNTLPYAGVYLSEDGQLGGTVHHELNEWYESFGFEPTHVPGTPDHISAQLEFLGFLSTLELQGIRGPYSAEMVNSARQQQSAFLLTQLLPWCVPFLISVKLQGDSFYKEVASLTQALIMSHYEEVASGESALTESALRESALRESARASLPTSPDLLANPKTGIKDIAQFICRPVYSGAHVTRKDIKRMASGLQLPSGFGDRVQLLTNTIRSAVQFDTVPSLLKQLRDHMLGFKEEYERVTEHTRAEIDILKEWTTKAEQTEALLASIESKLTESTQFE